DARSDRARRLRFRSARVRRVLLGARAQARARARARALALPRARARARALPRARARARAQSSSRPLARARGRSERGWQRGTGGRGERARRASIAETDPPGGGSDGRCEFPVERESRSSRAVGSDIRQPLPPRWKVDGARHRALPLTLAPRAASALAHRAREQRARPRARRAVHPGGALAPA